MCMASRVTERLAYVVAWPGAMAIAANGERYGPIGLVLLAAAGALYLLSRVFLRWHGSATGRCAACSTALMRQGDERWRSSSGI
jgi:hypothetical protein